MTPRYQGDGVDRYDRHSGRDVYEPAAFFLRALDYYHVFQRRQQLQGRPRRLREHRGAATRVLLTQEYSRFGPVMDDDGPTGYVSSTITNDDGRLIKSSSFPTIEGTTNENPSDAHRLTRHIRSLRLGFPEGAVPRLSRTRSIGPTDSSTPTTRRGSAAVSTVHVRYGSSAP